jgi:hypothetical protein
MPLTVAACAGQITETASGLSCSSGQFVGMTPSELYAVAQTLSPDPLVTSQFLAAGVGTGTVLYGTVLGIRAILRLMMFN